MIERVVVATDGSESVTRAIVTALDVADRFDATVYALYVLDTDDVDAAPEELKADVEDALESQGRAALDAVEETAQREVNTVVRTGRPEREIVDFARETDADLVALGTRGRHGEHRLLLGSVAEAVVRTCPVPVLSVRQLERRPAGS